MTGALRAWAPALVWAALLFAASARPSLPSPRLPGLDKVEHFAAYAVFGVLLARGAQASGVAPVWALAAGLLYGASDEWHQAYVPGRSPDVRDWVADALGVGAGLFLYHRRRLRTPRTPVP